MTIRAGELIDLLEWAYEKGSIAEIRGTNVDNLKELKDVIAAYQECRKYISHLQQQMDKVGLEHDITFCYDAPPPPRKFKSS